MAKKGSERMPAAYEIDVFNFLLAHKESLGISELSRFRALLVDGELRLSDGRRLALEIKYRMNWTKACQAGWQFSQFLKTREAKERPVDGGLVFFEEFSGDWASKSRNRLLEVGWSRWYGGHSQVERLRIDLLRLRNGVYESFPAAIQAARATSAAVQPT